MNSNKKYGLYLHIPFCQRKCLYCDFFSAGEKVADWDILTDALLNEARYRKDELRSLPYTLYIGGGTPSLMPEDNFQKLIGGLREIYPGLQTEEFTIEANPDDITEKKIKIWKEEGVNRVSLGIQTFSDEELKAVGRRHTADQAEEALRMLTHNFDNVSADLIFGLPGQTPGSWRQSVERLIKIRPDHISAYSLMYEEGTALTVLRDSGRIQPAAEEESEGMFEYLNKELRKAGYERYEISNYSLPGKHSRHNTLYWEGSPYLGLGPSAHSYDGNRIRRRNPADLHRYLTEYAYQPSTPFYEEENLSDEELRDEFILTRMRLASGISLKEYEEGWGEKALHRLLKNAEKEKSIGCIKEAEGHISLTDKGIMLADSVILNLAL